MWLANSSVSRSKNANPIFHPAVQSQVTFAEVFRLEFVGSPPGMSNVKIQISSGGPKSGLLADMIVYSGVPLVRKTHPTVLYLFRPPGTIFSSCPLGSLCY
jgi:hypothetical protein